MDNFTLTQLNSRYLDQQNKAKGHYSRRKVKPVSREDYHFHNVLRGLAIAILGIFIVLFLFWATARAESINVDILADSIYMAEGGAKTNHPYGILAKYKHTTPRQACINTINHALRDWNGKGDFIAFLGSRYCPVGCDNDNGTNQYWVKNVRYFYNKYLSQ